VWLERLRFLVRRRELPAPAAGAVLAVGAETFTLEAAQPVERDSQALQWSLETAWGAPMRYRSVIGAGATQAPPRGGPFGLLDPALAGANTLTLGASFAVGRLLAGDRLTLLGDVTTYTLRADATAQANRFAVTIDPPLARDAAIGAPVTLACQREVTVIAALSDYQAREIMGGVQTGDRRLVLMQAALQAAGCPDTPKPGDSVIFEGASWQVQSATALYQGATPLAWDVQVRR
jgi:hypothetical protein